MTFEDWYKTEDKEKELKAFCWVMGGAVCPEDFKEYMKEAWEARYNTLTYQDL